MRTSRGGGGIAIELTNEPDDSGRPDPGFWIRGGGPLGNVGVELSVRFAGREVAWAVGPLWTDEPELWVPLFVPVDAVIDEAQAEWITPLSGTVVTDLGPRLVEGALAWPDGLDRPPHCWDEAAQQANAPHGVLGLDAASAVRADAETGAPSEAAAVAAEVLAGFSRDERGQLVDSEGDPTNVRFAAPAPPVAAPPRGQTGGLRE